MHQMTILTKPAADEHGRFLGSFFNGVALAAGVLTPEQIVRKYDITVAELDRIMEDLRGMTVLDALFSYPDGPRYDLLLWMVASSR